MNLSHQLAGKHVPIRALDTEGNPNPNVLLASTWHGSAPQGSRARFAAGPPPGSGTFRRAGARSGGYSASGSQWAAALPSAGAPVMQFCHQAAGLEGRHIQRFKKGHKRGRKTCVLSCISEQTFGGEACE